MTWKVSLDTAVVYLQGMSKPICEKLSGAQKTCENGRLKLLHMWTESRVQEDAVTLRKEQYEKKGAEATPSGASPLGPRKKGLLRGVHLAEKRE